MDFCRHRKWGCSECRLNISVWWLPQGSTPKRPYGRSVAWSVTVRARSQETFFNETEAQTVAKTKKKGYETQLSGGSNTEFHVIPLLDSCDEI